MSERRLSVLQIDEFELFFSRALTGRERIEYNERPGRNAPRTP